MDQQEDDVWGGLVPTDHSRPIIKVMFPRTMPRFVIGSTKDKDVDFDISQWDPSLTGKIHVTFCWNEKDKSVNDKNVHCYLITTKSRLLKVKDRYIRGKASLPPNCSVSIGPFEFTFVFYETVRSWKPENLLLFETNERYQLRKPLGTGSYGSVWLADDRVTRKPVAIKLIRCDEDADTDHLEQYQSEWKFEVQALDITPHRNLLRFHEAFTEDFGSDIVTEYLPGMGLHYYVTKYGRVDIHLACKIAKGICQGVNHLHEHKIMHRDLKDENIMINPETLDVTIIDMGLSRPDVLPASLSTANQGDQATADLLSYHATRLHSLSYELGTPQCVAPEVWKEGHHYNNKVDAYNIAILMFELLCGILAHSQEIEDNMQFVMQRSRDWLDVELPRLVDDKLAVDFIRRIGHEDPACRMSVKEALRHPWLSESTSEAGR